MRRRERLPRALGELAEMGEGEGLSRFADSCQKIEKMGREKGLSRDAVNF